MYFTVTQILIYFFVTQGIETEKCSLNKEGTALLA